MTREQELWYQTSSAPDFILMTGSHSILPDTLDEFDGFALKSSCQLSATYRIIILFGK